MSRLQAKSLDVRVLKTLRALGGQATLGDLLALNARSRGEVEGSLDRLIAGESVHVRVPESGDVVYHLGRDVGKVGVPLRPATNVASVEQLPMRERVASRPTGFDRKTLRLIRAREGVLSLAELVEHTGLCLRDAEAEMSRLAESYGGVPHVSLDGHVVHAFPELMTSSIGRFPLREPRPAWARANDPIRSARSDPRRAALGAAVEVAGLAASTVAPWLALAAPGPVALGVLALSATGFVAFGGRIVRRIGRHRAFRFRDPEVLRRYALGIVVETSLKGKGVVSLTRAVERLQARAGRRKVSRSAVELALRELAREFDAPINELNGDFFFGFRNVKRQFLASETVRREIRLGRTPFGRVVFDTADSPEAAAARELEAFDRRLARRRTRELIEELDLRGAPPEDREATGP